MVNASPITTRTQNDADRLTQISPPCEGADIEADATTQGVDDAEPRAETPTQMPIEHVASMHIDTHAAQLELVPQTQLSPDPTSNLTTRAAVNTAADATTPGEDNQELHADVVSTSQTPIEQVPTTVNLCDTSNTSSGINGFDDMYIHGTDDWDEEDQGEAQQTYEENNPILDSNLGTIVNEESLESEVKRLGQANFVKYHKTSSRKKFTYIKFICCEKTRNSCGAYINFKKTKNGFKIVGSSANHTHPLSREANLKLRLQSRVSRATLGARQ